MTPSELERAVSQATGEDRAVIAARGFSLLDEEPPVSEEDVLVLIVAEEQRAAALRGPTPLDVSNQRTTVCRYD